MMNTILWVLQILLALFFIMPGYGKLFSSRQQHIEDKHIKPDGQVWPIRVLGVLEWLGCIGIILPWYTGIARVLTPVSALGFGLIMLAGIFMHGRRKEYKMLPMLFIVFLMAVIVTYCRFAGV
ncbi:DoxX family protein [Edaphocola aurantiacus]|uniref:DoxX family protein n=1 Tax=Edaphocola aurantiacus TaxID=2601682 RepID=UPI001C98B6C0|nr:DoxX family protein [Edaphocola aurantiacus]